LVKFFGEEEQEAEAEEDEEEEERQSAGQSVGQSAPGKIECWGVKNFDLGSNFS
jgi:hypothetical protein